MPTSFEHQTRLPSSSACVKRFLCMIWASAVARTSNRCVSTSIWRRWTHVGFSQTLTKPYIGFRVFEFLLAKEGQQRDVERNGRTSERFHDAKLPDSSHVDIFRWYILIKSCFPVRFSHAPSEESHETDESWFVDEIRIVRGKELLRRKGGSLCLQMTAAFGELWLKIY